MSDKPLVHIVDDEEGVRQVFAGYLQLVDADIRTYPSGEQFLEQADTGRPACLLLDLRLVGMAGEEVLETMRRRGWRMPVIVVTAHGDVPIAVDLMRQGVFDFVQKPVQRDTLVERVRQALAADETRRCEEAEQTEAQRRWERLSEREREVARLVVEGLATKQIADRLSISPRTVEGHRAHIMSKCEVEAVAQLVTLALRAEAAQPRAVSSSGAPAD
jgi:two-component system response regulator FixJ